MEFRILGPLEVVENGQALDLGGQKQRALLAVLVLEANRCVSRERLVDALWEDAPTATSVKALQVLVSQLRKIFGNERLQTRSPGYLLRVDEDELDLRRFQRLHGEGRHAEALSLWRGSPLADLADLRFAQPEIGRLEELRLSCLEDRLDDDLDAGRHAELVGELDTLVGEHPLRQRLRAQLMLALYRSGRDAEALEVYRRARGALVEALGIEPSRELHELQRAILNQDPSLERHLRPARELAPLPAAANPLIGRQSELSALRDLLLGPARLVTLTGAGGSGKTRLALEVATTLQTDFVDRVGFVPLAPLAQPDQLPATIVSALNIGNAANQPPFEALKHALLDRASLLVLDNLEHLLAAAPLLADLLAACPRMKILATSRSSLHLSGEHEFLLHPLPAGDAITLLSERARAVRPDFAGDGAALAAICARLDCLPLALELAASHLRLLSPPELLERIDDRLPLLTGGARDLATRQQTLRATIEWSYDLLDREEQQLFARLAVFAGGCTLEAAERVCGATIDHVEALADKNLLGRQELAGETRFFMLETIREYALERLEADAALEGACQAYADYYLALARERVAELDQGHLTALHGLERELDNFLSAFAWTHSPEGVPAPIDDGACSHLLGRTIPPITVDTSHGPVNLAELAAQRLVLYVYPGTTKPGRPPIPGLYALPGGRGCTAESRAFRDHATELAALNAHVAGLSIQTLDDQLEFADRAQMPFPLIADPERQLETTLSLPTFEIDGHTLYQRVTLIADHAKIIKVFYPVFPPDRNAQQVITWLTDTNRTAHAQTASPTPSPQATAEPPP
jgi:predicted ATPase/DNA-binding SARP family transcriptional activator/peroxiredoxin